MKNYIKQFREIFEVTQKQLAMSVGLTQNKVSVYENSDKVISGPTVKKISQALHIPVMTLQTGYVEFEVCGKVNISSTDKNVVPDIFDKLSPMCIFYQYLDVKKLINNKYCVMKVAKSKCHCCSVNEESYVIIEKTGSYADKDIIVLKSTKGYYVLGQYIEEINKSSIKKDGELILKSTHHNGNKDMYVSYKYEEVFGKVIYCLNQQPII